MTSTLPWHPWSSSSLPLCQHDNTSSSMYNSNVHNAHPGLGRLRVDATAEPSTSMSSPSSQNVDTDSFSLATSTSTTPTSHEAGHSASSRPSTEDFASFKAPSTHSSLSRTPSASAASYYSRVDPLQTSPVGPIAIQQPHGDGAPPLALPKASPLMMAYPNSHQQQPAIPSMSENNASPRSSGLIRRLSRGARSTISRKASQKDLSRRRDQSSGPTILRRRSNSRSVAVDGSNPTAYGPPDMSDLELDADVEDTVFEADEPEEQSTPTGSRLAPYGGGRLSQSDLPPSIPIELLAGTLMTRVTNRKRKQLIFAYDDSAAKIFWSTYRIPKQVYIDDIREIRSGDEIVMELSKKEEPETSKDRWITIVYDDSDRSKGSSNKYLHLMAPTIMVRDIWVRALEALLRYREGMMAGMAGNSEQSRKAAWVREMSRRDRLNSSGLQRVGFSEIKQFCRSFSIFKSNHDLSIQFARADVERCGSLNYEQYLEFFRHLTERQDIRRVFEAAKSTNDSHMSREDFLAFLQREQGADLAKDPEGYWNNIFDKLTAAQQKARGWPLPIDSIVPFSQGMAFETFQRFLLNEKFNSAVIKSRSAPLLDRPLNEYFISSSHNTYLLGRQVGGESSAQAYIEPLKKNCRCVEIDCWDGDDGKPKVTHGRTWTSKASFMECIKVINKYAFHASQYPLIISLEVHCNPEQQKIMAQNMKDVFGDQLLLYPIPSEDHEEILPSPEQLRGKILIKVKEPKPEPINPPPIPEVPIVPAMHRRQRSKSAPTPHIPPSSIPIRRPTVTQATDGARFVNNSPPLQSGFMPAITMAEPRISIASNPTSVSATSSDDSDIGNESSSVSSKKKPKTSNIVKVLGEMGVYTRGIKFQDFRTLPSRTFNHVFSFNEATFENRCKNAEAKHQLERHNQRYLMRVYPRPNRITSSNFNPLQFWRRGVQMAATNWQTYDLGTQINDAMFAVGHDASGYVLKPDELRRGRDERAIDGKRKLRRKLVKFKVRIISAQHLTAPMDLKSDQEMNPYVELEVFSADDRAKNLAIGAGGIDASDRQGMSGIGSPHRRRTQVVPHNGYDPNWDEELSMTVDTKYPSLVFVRLTVWNSPDPSSGRLGREPSAMYTAKLSSLQMGYRHIRLCNHKGEPTISTLFVQMQVSQPVDPEVIHAPISMETGQDLPGRSSEEGTRTGKDFLRRMFQRTPSQHRKNRPELDQNRSTSSTPMPTQLPPSKS